MSVCVNVNGILFDPEQAVVPALDHGFLFGDSIYETLRTYRRVPFLLGRHLDRCENSALGLGIEIPWERARMREEVERTLARADNEESMVRIVVTRGAGKLDMDPATAGPPNALIFAAPHPVYPDRLYSQGAEVHLVRCGRYAWGGVDPTIKSGSRLANVLALAEARRSGAFESVLCNGHGDLTEGTSSNLFLVVGGEVRTPRVEAGLLPGITRQVVLEVAAEQGTPIRETTLDLADLEAAEEAFLTSTTKKVMPVQRIGDKRFEAPGPRTRTLMQAFDARVEREISRKV